MDEQPEQRASQAGTLTPDQRRKVAQIKAALGGSDRAVRDHFYSLDTFERSAKKYKSGRVAGPWVDTLTKLRGELLGARNRLDDLNTGLSAQVLLRRSLTDTVAAIAAWRTALSSSDPQVISAAITRMQNRFAAAESNGRRGAFYLERGR